jgi:hypothetical protein
MITALSPASDPVTPASCAGCGGKKEAPIATIVAIYHLSLGVTLALCEVCGRDLANAVGFMCIRDGGWSKLEPRKRAPKQNDETNDGGKAR